MKAECIWRFYLTTIVKLRNYVWLELFYFERRVIVVVNWANCFFKIFLNQILIVEIVTSLALFYLAIRISLQMSEWNAAICILVIWNVRNYSVFEVQSVHVFTNPVFVPSKYVLLKQLHTFSSWRYVKHHKEDQRKWNQYRDGNAYLIKDLVRSRSIFQLTLWPSKP